MPYTEYLKIFAGLGIFFVGINLLSDHLKQHGKPYVSKLLKALTDSDIKSILSGALAGGVTNSGKAVTFTLIGFVASGILSARRALPVIVGASFGSSLLVLWVSIDFKVLELIMLGIAGFYYQFGNMKQARSKFIAGLVLGLGLIFFGLDMLKAGAEPMKHNPDFIKFVSATHGYWLSAFAIGAIGAFVTQSGSSISIIAISFVGAGLLDFDQMVMLIYGTNIGSGFSTATLAFGMKGASRQLVFFHAAMKMVGSLVLVPLLYIETHFQVPAVKHIASLVSSDKGVQIGSIYILYEIVSALMLWLCMYPVSLLLESLWPPSAEESLSRLEFISPTAKLNLDEAAFMIEKEQARLLARAPHYFDDYRDKVPAHKKIPAETLFEANVSVEKEIQARISELLKRDLSTDHTEDLLQRHSIHEWITTINRDMYELVKLLNKNKSRGIPRGFILSIIGGIDALLDVACDSISSGDTASAYLLIEMTEHRETLLSRVKPRHLAMDGGIAIDTKKILLDIVVYYERIVWILNKMAHTMAKDLEELNPDYLGGRAPRTDQVPRTNLQHRDNFVMARHTTLHG